MDKLERLLNLTAELLNTARPITAEEIRRRMGGAYPEALDSFRRSFERDKADLRSIGVPIRSSPAPDIDPPVEGYRIRRDEYAGRNLGLAPDELAALHLAANLVRLEGGVGDAFTKLGGPFAGPGRGDGTSTGEPDGDETGSAGPDGDRTESAGPDDGGPDGDGPGPDGPESDRPGSAVGAAVGALPFDEPLAALVEGAARRRVAAFVYSGEARTVEPWRLSFSRGHWYLSGWDRDREAERLFRVDRMTGPVTLGGPAAQEPPPPDPIGPLLGWELGDAEPVAAKVSVDADLAAWACHVTGTDGEPQPDGSVVLTLNVRNPDAFRSLVLSFLDRAEVLAPEELRRDVIGWLETLAADGGTQ